MTREDAYGSIVDQVGNRLLPIAERIERREFSAELDGRIVIVAREVEATLRRWNELTPARRKRLVDQVVGDLRAGRSAIAAHAMDDAEAAFTRAIHGINDVAAEVARGRE